MGFYRVTKKQSGEGIPLITKSGSIVSFDDSVGGVPVNDLVASIVAAQSGSGDPSPSNIRPISGFTGVNVHVADGETPHVVDNIYSVTWQSEAGTVYGGYIDLTTGVLTVTHEMVDLADLSWIYQQDYSRWLTIGIKTTIKINSTTDTSKVIPAYCEKYKPTSYANLSTNEITYYNSNGNVFCNNGSSSETPTGKLVYLLATPQTYQLTPKEVATILGTNHIFADTGDIDAVFYKSSVSNLAKLVEQSKALGAIT